MEELGRLGTACRENARRHHGGSRLILRSLHSIPEKDMFQMSESKPESNSCSKQDGRRQMALTCFRNALTCFDML